MVSDLSMYIFQLASGVGDYNICACEGSMGIELMTARWKNPIPSELVLSINKRERANAIFKYHIHSLCHAYPPGTTNDSI